MATKLDYRDFRTLPELVKAVKEAGLAKNLTEARKIIAKMIPKESYFQTKIIKYLKSIDGAFVWKEQAGGGFQRNGIPDVCAVIKGRFYGFEIKRPFIGKLSEIQRYTIEDINKAGGGAYVVTYVSEVEEILWRDGVL